MILKIDYETEKKVIIFDLDGTLAPSRGVVDNEMVDLLRKLIRHYKVAVISGGSIEQYQKQFLPYLQLPEELQSNLMLLPTSGSSLYYCDGDELVEVYSKKFSPEQSKLVKEALELILNQNSLPKQTEYGSTIQDRGTQITYSALGHSAPLSEKSAWDPDQQKRRQLSQELSKLLPDFDILIGGTTSIDITLKGINKAYGVRQLSDFLKIPISAMIFVGDSLFEGGNDDSVRETGIDCIKVDTVEDTKEVIRQLLEIKQ